MAYLKNTDIQTLFHATSSSANVQLCCNCTAFQHLRTPCINRVSLSSCFLHSKGLTYYLLSVISSVYCQVEKTFSQVIIFYMTLLLPHSHFDRHSILIGLRSGPSPVTFSFPVPLLQFAGVLQLIAISHLILNALIYRGIHGHSDYKLKSSPIHHCAGQWWMGGAMLCLVLAERFCCASKFHLSTGHCVRGLVISPGAVQSFFLILLS